MSDPNQADLRVLDGFNPDEPLLEFLRREGRDGGPRRARPGQRHRRPDGHLPHLRARTAEAMTLRFPAGLLVNLGESPKRAYPNKLPTTRMGTAALVRTAFAQAQNHARKLAAAKDEDKQPPRNLKLEALELALDAQGAGDLRRPPRRRPATRPCGWRKEFDLKARLDLATEGYLMADASAEAKVPVVVHPTMQRAGAAWRRTTATCATRRCWPTTRSRWPSAPASRATCPRRACCGTRRRWRWSTAWATTGRWRRSRWTRQDPGHRRPRRQHRGGQGRRPGAVRRRPVRARHARDAHDAWTAGWCTTAAEYLKLPFARRALPLTRRRRGLLPGAVVRADGCLAGSTWRMPHGTIAAGK